jgi:hypothetical protein
MPEHLSRPRRTNTHPLVSHNVDTLIQNTVREVFPSLSGLSSGGADRRGDRLRGEVEII